MKTSIYISENARNFVFENVLNVIKISEPLQKEANIDFMLYTKYFDDGTIVDLTTKKDWVNHYYAKYFIGKEHSISADRFKSGVNYWRRSTNPITLEIKEDAYDNFDIDARIDFVYRDESNKCFHSYIFCTNKKNANKAYAFYGNHMSKLLKFIPYFNKKAHNLIIEADKLENRLIIAKHKPIIIEKAIAPRNLTEELRRENASFEPTSREFEVLLLYAHGVSKAKIGQMLNKSENTVMTHLQHIRNKSHLTDRFSMMMYLKDRGEDMCINFFFPYVPRQAA